MYVHLIALKRGDARHTGPAIALRRHTHGWIEGGGGRRIENAKTWNKIVHIFKLNALRSPKRTDVIHLFHAVIARTSCSNLSFQSSCWAQCYISYAI